MSLNVWKRHTDDVLFKEFVTYSILYWMVLKRPVYGLHIQTACSFSVAHIMITIHTSDHLWHISNAVLLLLYDRRQSNAPLRMYALLLQLIRFEWFLWPKMISEFRHIRVAVWQFCAAAFDTFSLKKRLKIPFEVHFFIAMSLFSNEVVLQSVKMALLFLFI